MGVSLYVYLGIESWWGLITRIIKVNPTRTLLTTMNIWWKLKQLGTLCGNKVKSTLSPADVPGYIVTWLWEAWPFLALGRLNAVSGWPVCSGREVWRSGVQVWFSRQHLCVHSLSTHVHTQTADAHTPVITTLLPLPFPSRVVNFPLHRYSLCVL